MTAFPNTPAAPGRRSQSARRVAPADHRVEEAYWGYVVRPLAPLSRLTAVMQVAATAGGVVALALTAGLWLVPLHDDSVTLLAFRLAASLVLAAAGTLLLWVGNRGTRRELQVDIAMGEVREVVRNRSGLPTLLGRHAFNAVGGVFLARGPDGRRGRASLVIRLGNSPQIVTVASGPEEALLPLRDRLGQDLMIRPRTPAPEPDAPQSRRSRLPPLAEPAL
ncbi:hypothetical protein [Pseudoroseicyclus tamaricis]|uniref:Uncharacterized protein n=1 Tax=Pseudoroseicyclus tamaricis TaxID=2705421 RepID=A0A6B2JHS0_9RHOB|nr:hypothetical protein [Pseudoroseicyclus tamaricis]NDV00833.1 hypothetical protein [Pseudoroseicyclus tamaricis]